MKTRRNLLILVVGSAMVFACGEAQEAPSQDDGFVPASDATWAELGVARWFTKDPSAIEGYDEHAQVVVSLKHLVSNEGSAATHSFELHEHEHVAVTQFVLEKNVEGVQTFAPLRDEGNAPFVERALDRMKADLQPSEASLTAQDVTGSTLHATDVPWTAPSIQLTCGKVELMNGAETCMKHKTSVPQEAKAWALACTAYVEQNPGATRDNTACQPTQSNACSCMDLTRTPWDYGDGNICEYSFAGVGQLERPAGCDDPSVQCPKQTKKCTAKAEWCKQPNHNC